MIINNLFRFFFSFSFFFSLVDIFFIISLNPRIMSVVPFVSEERKKKKRKMLLGNAHWDEHTQMRNDLSEKWAEKANRRTEQ